MENPHNFVLLKSGFGNKQEVMYVDMSPDYKADACFIKHEVPMKFSKKEFKKPGAKYAVNHAKFSKGDIEKVKAALEELWNNMLLFGYTDYRMFCEEHFWNLFK